MQVLFNGFQICTKTGVREFPCKGAPAGEANWHIGAFNVWEVSPKGYPHKNKSSLVPLPQAAKPGCTASIQDEGLAKELRLKYQDMVGACKWLPKVKHAVKHIIETTPKRPVSYSYRRLDTEKLAASKEEFAPRLAQGIIWQSKTSWSSPPAHG